MTTAKRIWELVEEFALSLPEAWIDHPWGDDAVVKVGKKIFVFFGQGQGHGGVDGPRVVCKLIESHDHALSLPGSYLPAYGLGKNGWVGLRLTELDEDDGELLVDFVEESYRTVAPKKLVKLLDQQFEHEELD